MQPAQISTALVLARYHHHASTPPTPSNQGDSSINREEMDHLRGIQRLSFLESMPANSRLDGVDAALTQLLIQERHYLAASAPYTSATENENFGGKSVPLVDPATICGDSFATTSEELLACLPPPPPSPPPPSKTMPPHQALPTRPSPPQHHHQQQQRRPQHLPLPPAAAPPPPFAPSAQPPPPPSRLPNAIAYHRQDPMFYQQQHHPPPPPRGPVSNAPSQQPQMPRFATAGEIRCRDNNRKRPFPTGGGGGGDGSNDYDSHARQPPPYQQQQLQQQPYGRPPASFRGNHCPGGGGGGGGHPHYQQQQQQQSGFLGSRLGFGAGRGGRNEWDRRGEEEEGGSSSIDITGGHGFNPRVMKKFQVPTKGGGAAQESPSSSGGNGKGNIRGMVHRAFAGPSKNNGASGSKDQAEEEEELPERLKGCDPALIERIENEIIDRGDPLTFDDIAGLAFAKKQVIELVVWPIKNPELFTGLRQLPKGLLLFGPPGTGKTLIAKAIASQCAATFFNISASSLTSKWIGESEKLVRTLFAVASINQPAIIFIDEVDSLLSQRSVDENEASRRLKTEFLVQLDGAGTSSEDRILVVGATNRPQELDEAARRRFVKRLYIPLPEPEARRALVTLLLKSNSHQLTPQDIEMVVEKTAEFSGADLKALCTEAAMGPIRDLTSGLAAAGRGEASGSMGGSDINNVSLADIPPISFHHFQEALETVRPSVSEQDLGALFAWNQSFGSFKRGAVGAPPPPSSFQQQGT